MYAMFRLIFQAIRVVWEEALKVADQSKSKR